MRGQPVERAGTRVPRDESRGETRWEDLELVHHWRTYLDSPRRYLRHLLE
ncbi:hypothetical protein [Microbacterium aurum]|nr:hypothetical protein [Microbacterium aurum]MBM7828298.1 hypothetical protein [Microbacterium aurum]